MAFSARVAKQSKDSSTSQTTHEAFPLQDERRPEYASKQWVESKMIQVVTMALRGRPANLHPGNPQPRIERNPALAITALMSLARLKGYIIEKKQSLAGKVDLGKLAPADLRAVLEGSLDQLAPGERQRLLEIASGATIEPDPIES